jgi:agmatinase
MALEDAKNQIDHAFTRADLKGLSFENVFAGAPSFLRRRYGKDLAGVDIAVTGIPFDQAVTNRPGTRLGPRAIREASALQTVDPAFGWDGMSPLEEFAILDYGDMAFDYAHTPDVPARIAAHAATILDAGAACFALGGDHSITLPLLRAHAAKHGPLALIQVDAHTDTWPDDDPSADRPRHVLLHGGEGGADRRRTLRSYRHPHGGGGQSRHRHPRRAGGACQGAGGDRGDRAGPRGRAPVYLSFDIDGLDPAFAPGTGTPVWGGMSSAQAAVFLRGLAGINLVGGDVVEVSPPFDPTGITAIAAAHVMFEQICLWGWTRR